MRPAILAGLCAVALAGCLPAGAEFGSTPALTNFVPDPTYRAKVGDRAVLYGVDQGSPMDAIPLLLDATAHDKFERLRRTAGVIELTELEERKELQWTPSGTRVIVIAVYDRSHTGSRLAAEVRLLDGPHKDRNLWTPLEYVAKFKIAAPD